MPPGRLDPDHSGLRYRLNRNGIDDAFELVTHHAALSTLWRNAAPLSCVNLEPKLTAMTKSVNQFKRYTNSVIGIRKLIARSCRLNSTVKFNNEAKAKAAVYRNQLLGIVATLPLVDYSTCMLGTCVSNDYSAKKTSIITLHQKLYTHVRGLLAPNCKNYGFYKSLVRRRLAKLQDYYNTGQPFASYPTAPVTCTQ